MSESDEEPEDEAEAEAPKPNRRKRRRRRARSEESVEANKRAKAKDEEGDESEEAEPSDASEREELPAFARAFPRDPELDALVRAFEAGDYARVRREAPALAERAKSKKVKQAARELRRRIDPDPLATFLLVGAVLLLVFLALWYWTQAHG